MAKAKKATGKAKEVHEEAQGDGGQLKRLVSTRLATLGLKRSDICTEETGITPGRLSLWLIHGADSMNVRSLRKLAAALRCSPGALLHTGDGVPEELLKAA